MQRALAHASILEAAREAGEFLLTSCPANALQAESAIQLAPQVMYFAECMRRRMPFARPDAKNLSSTIAKPELRCFKVLRIVNPMAYAYVKLLDAL